MAPPFAVFVTARFERDYRALLKGHRALATDYATVVGVLGTDPYNRTRQHPVKKLEQVVPGDGQYPDPVRSFPVSIRHRRSSGVPESL